MAKLTKPQRAAHMRAVELLENGRDLSQEEREFILENWHPGAAGDHGAASAFFTPAELANDFQLEIHGEIIVDLCAGIGGLAYYATGRQNWPECRPSFRRIVCVERNPAFVAVGRRVLPEAEWICGDALDPAVWAQVGAVDFAISNPPFGRITKSHYAAPRYDGAEAEFQILDVAMMLAPCGAAIIPQMSAGFRFSGARNHERAETPKYRKFVAATGASLRAGVGIDCTVHRDQWREVAPNVEIACWNFEEYGETPRPIQQPEFFAIAAE